MAKQLSDLQEEWKTLTLSATELKNELDHSKKMSLELNEALEQSTESIKKVEEEFNDYKVAKETVINEITADREQLRTCVTEMKVSSIAF